MVIFTIVKKVYVVFYYILYYPEGTTFFMVISIRKIKNNIIIVDSTV